MRLFPGYFVGFHSLSFLYDQRSLDGFHDVRCRQVVFKQLCHRPQVLADVAKKFPVSLAEIVQSRFVVHCPGKPMLGATPLQAAKNLTLPAPQGQGCFLAYAEA